MSTKRQKWIHLFYIVIAVVFAFSCNKDETPPVITILGSNPLIYCNQFPETPPYTDPGATALDDEDGDITSGINVSSNVDVNVPGTYNVTYTVKDKAGNSTTATRQVQVMYCK
jgi:hypothetical protein